MYDACFVLTPERHACAFEGKERPSHALLCLRFCLRHSFGIVPPRWNGPPEFLACTTKKARSCLACTARSCPSKLGLQVGGIGGPEAAAAHLVEATAFGRRLGALTGASAAMADAQETIEELRRSLEEERRARKWLEEELERWKTASDAGTDERTHDDPTTSKLIQRREMLQVEREALQTEVEREKAFVENILRRKLEQVSQEKVALERKLESEQEYVVNKLQKQLDALKIERRKIHEDKVRLERQLEAEQEHIVNKLQRRVDELGREKRTLLNDKAALKRQVSELKDDKLKLCNDKVILENQMEAEEEKIVNRLQKQIEDLLITKQSLERQLETFRRFSKLSESETSEDELGIHVSRNVARYSGSRSAHSSQERGQVILGKYRTPQHGKMASGHRRTGSGQYDAVAEVSASTMGRQGESDP